MDRRTFFGRLPALFERANRVSWERYEETLYDMRRPVTWGNMNRIRQFVGTGNMSATAMRDERVHTDLDRILQKSRYPRAGQLNRLAEVAEGNIELATALLHFNNPAYPIFDAMSVRGLNDLGFNVHFTRQLSDDVAPDYQGYIEAIQELKDAVPYYCVPEKNHYLTRIVQAGLWQMGVDLGPLVTAKGTPAR